MCLVVPKPPCEIVAAKGSTEAAQGPERCWLKHSTQMMEKEEGWHLVMMVSVPSLSTYVLLSHNFSHYYMRKLSQMPWLSMGRMHMYLRSYTITETSTDPGVSLNESLYAPAKYIQWNCPQIHGEDKCLMVSISRCIVIWNTWHYLEASNWTTAYIPRKKSHPLAQQTLPQSSPPHQDKTCPPSECSYVDKATAQCLPLYCGTTWWEQQRGLKTSIDQQKFNHNILPFKLLHTPYQKVKEALHHWRIGQEDALPIHWHLKGRKCGICLGYRKGLIFCCHFQLMPGPGLAFRLPHGQEVRSMVESPASLLPWPSNGRRNNSHLHRPQIMMHTGFATRLFPLWWGCRPVCHLWFELQVERGSAL